jgi:hypothetical protein
MGVLPAVGLEMALLVAVIAVGQAVLIFGRLMNTLPASPGSGSRERAADRHP